MYPGVYNFFKRDGFHIGLGQWYGAIDRNLVSYLNDCIKSPPVARMIKKLNAKPRELHAHALPWLQYPGKTYAYNVMLIGDAAGFPCPLEAEGIWHAMYSGKLAALTAKEALDNGDVSEEQLKKYEEAWVNSPLGEEFAAGKEFQEFWANVPFGKHMDVFIELTNDMLNLFTGATSHLEMSQKFLKNLRNNLPTIMPVFRKYVFPYIFRVLEEELDDIKGLIPFMENMRPKKKVRKRN